MKKKILLQIENGEADAKFELLKELFRDSGFEIELITQESESMSGKIITKKWIQFYKSDAE